MDSSRGRRRSWPAGSPGQNPCGIIWPLRIYPSSADISGSPRSWRLSRCSTSGCASEKGPAPPWPCPARCGLRHLQRNGHVSGGGRVGEKRNRRAEIALMTRLLLAFQFLSIFPIRISGTVRDEDLAGSMRYYPLVAPFWGLERDFLLGRPAAFHSGGCGRLRRDRADSFFRRPSSRRFRRHVRRVLRESSREQILAIMKDSRSGAMAIVGFFACSL